MVTLNRIYTRTGDRGKTRLATGAAVSKTHPRVEAYGAVDELNAQIGWARTTLVAEPLLDAMLARIQNDLFDLGADLATPARARGAEDLRVLEGQVARLEGEIDELNAELSPLTSFVLPGGSSPAAALHVCRTVCRRAERAGVRLGEAQGEQVSPAALKYLNRLSDLFFVAARFANAKGADDILWRPGATR
ncbi:MAG TPA: cob(I)yrinic acid a,c-diamide adenosyltransferase [Caulobacteraceae bacterium]|jgi:cob(I)alamin adenosyltransferase|nr:cob(I)yrinic acid a,c-diamide adenosyltransferase [Caulobacteraceae bacterium]